MRKYVVLDEMVVKWIGTTEMLADGFTSVLPRPTLANLRHKLQLRNLSPVGRVVIYAGEGVATSALLGLMHGRLTICLCVLSRGRNVLFNLASVCGDSDIKCLNDCV